MRAAAEGHMGGVLARDVEAVRIGEHVRIAVGPAQRDEQRLRLLDRAAADLHVAPRDIRFDLETARQGHWLGGDPVGTAVFNALSLTFPDGERMFMDAVKAYRDRLTGKLAQDARGFIAQEAIHSREHHQLNSLIDRDRYPVAEIEETIRGRVKMARERGPMAMLISTIALEHFTAMMAEMHARHRNLFGTTDPEIEKLWRWHAVEETEHKAVAYDVFLEVTKDWSPLKRYVAREVYPHLRASAG